MKVIYPEGDYSEGDDHGINAIFIVAGAVVGLLVVRGFMLDSIEEIAWRMFWDEVFKRHIDITNWGEVLKSATFTKSAIGMAFGGIVGFHVASKFATATRAAKKGKELPGE